MFLLEPCHARSGAAANWVACDCVQDSPVLLPGSHVMKNSALGEACQWGACDAPSPGRGAQPGPYSTPCHTLASAGGSAPARPGDKDLHVAHVQCSCGASSSSPVYSRPPPPLLRAGGWRYPQPTAELSSLIRWCPSDGTQATVPRNSQLSQEIGCWKKVLGAVRAWGQAECHQERLPGGGSLKGET